MNENENVEYYLGIDGGGTKTEFALADKDGNIVSTIVLRGSNPNDVGMMETYSVLKEGIFALCDDVNVHIPLKKISVFAGLAGCSSAENMPKITYFLSKFGFNRYANHNDAYNAVAAGLGNGDGVAVIMGTGSIAYAKKGNDLHRIGGYGFLFGDEGSGFAIGRDVILAALQFEDGMGKNTLLYDMVKERCGGETVLSKIDGFYLGGKTEIAKYAPLVFDAYEKGDEVAHRILDKNLSAVAEMIAAAGKKTGNSRVKVALLGGLTARADIIIPIIERLLPPSETVYMVEACNTSPVKGALYLAGMKE